MSKSVGNVVEPVDLIDTFGVDYVRYFLASEMMLGNDGDFSKLSFNKKINELADDVGNLLQRVLTLINKNCEGCVPKKGTLHSEDEELLRQAKEAKSLIRNQLEELNIKGICDITIEIARSANRYTNKQEPWKLAKSDRQRMETVLYVLFDVLRIVGIYLEPVIPSSSEKLFKQLGVSDDLTSLDSVDADLPSSIRIGIPSVLFPKPK
jgi:methionyl-tRNA synthetase